MNGGWVPCIASWWEATAAALQASGQPWPEEAVLMDLRWWADQEAHGGAKRPGRPTLCARWNWKEGIRARRLMASEAIWGDPIAASRQPGSSQEAASPPTVETPQLDANSQEAASDQPATSPTRDPIHPTPSPSPEDISAPSEPPPAEAGEQPAPRLDLAVTWSRIVAIRGGKPLLLTEARRRQLRGAMREIGSEGVILIAEWVVGAGGRAAFLREGGHDSPDTYLRPAHLGEYHDLARAWDEGGRKADSPTPPLRAMPVPLEDWREKRLREGRGRVEEERRVRRAAGLLDDEPRALAGGG